MEMEKRRKRRKPKKHVLNIFVAEVVVFEVRGTLYTE